MQTFQLQHILTYLKEGCRFKSINQPSILVKQSGDHVMVSSLNYHAKLSLEDFQIMYEATLFVLDEEEESTIDLEKDSEFYRWKQ